MTAQEQPIPRTPPSTLSELAWTALDFRLHMKRIGRESETALEVTRDRHECTVRHAAAAAALARRDQAALQAYATYLLPYADDLLAAARHALYALPPARHTTAWQSLLDSLAASHTKSAKVLSQPAEPYDRPCPAAGGLAAPRLVGRPQLPRHRNHRRRQAP
ncbi:hypothetical protein [Streptomyces sp. SP17KL33]|uniref:hypothetical protein n=1 Tax=Streptomyces sp. SP17KL33 TaxID=3002534 RepID=UPI002E7853EA|nr:hypothetical protein [Streptomyces sp. SP17KL33]